MIVLIVKRLILIGDIFVLGGFNESEWKTALGIRQPALYQDCRCKTVGVIAEICCNIIM
jgi:hypothetical protein